MIDSLVISIKQPYLPNVLFPSLFHSMQNRLWVPIHTIAIHEKGSYKQGHQEGEGSQGAWAPLPQLNNYNDIHALTKLLLHSFFGSSIVASLMHEYKRFFGKNVMSQLYSCNMMASSQLFSLYVSIYIWGLGILLSKKFENYIWLYTFCTLSNLRRDLAGTRAACTFHKGHFLWKCIKMYHFKHFLKNFLGGNL